MAAVRVIARFFAKPEFVDQVKIILAGQVALTRNETGCLLYELWQNTDDPSDFTFVEEWASADALAVHAQTEHISASKPKLVGMLQTEADIRIYTLLEIA